MAFVGGREERRRWRFTRLEVVEVPFLLYGERRGREDKSRKVKGFVRTQAVLFMLSWLLKCVGGEWELGVVKGWVKLSLLKYVGAFLA